MEEGTRSGDSNGVVVKNRNSSGCLIIRKKSDGKGVGVVGSSGSRPVFDSKKEKKRPRLVGSDSGSSDERLEQYRRRVGNGYDKRIIEKSDEGGRKRSSMELIDYRNDVDGSERKMTSRLGVFEFDEYDAIDDSDDEVGGKGFSGLKAMGGSGIRREFETGTSNGDIVYKRKHSYFDRASDYVNNRFEVKRGGARVPPSFLRDKFGDTSEEPIRVQGRNGVLKVMPNKKKKGSGLLKTYDHLEAGLRSKDAVKRNELARPSFYSEQKVHSKAGSSAMAEKSKLNLQKPSATKNSKALDWESDNSDTSLKLGKNKLVLQKSPVTKKSKALDWESDNSDTSLKLGPKKLEGDKPVKLVRNKGEVTPPSEKIPATGSNEGKIKRGSGTEKQKLREQIRKMLLDAGWTIDYRPRRNRDYQDAVYVNPSGTAYWSIVKAYDALQKQFDEEDDSLKPSGDCSSFSPISENVLSKLTRQTRKKIEKEMKRKQRDANVAKNAQESAGKKSSKYKHDTASKGSDRPEEKLSSFLKQGGKSWKGRTIENVVNDSNAESQNEASEDNLNGNLSIHGRKSRKLGRCTLVVRSTKNGQNSETDGYIPYTGKRTLLSWLIDSETVGSSEKVQYMNRRQTRVMQEGWITRDGIHCGCCSKILTVTKFEIHAGSKLRQPFQNIYLESGISLLQCQMDAWNKQEESERSSYHSVYVDGDDPNDDTCGICGDGGDLICCDGCPSTFHQTCLGIQMLPTGDWHCPNCTCKLCGMAGSSIAQGNEKTGCALPTCSLCERKYHQSCVLDVDALPVDSTCPSFCGQKCREMFENLQKFLGVKHELEGGFSWSLIHRTDISDSDTSVRGLTQRVECNSKLAVALTVMDECFLPILDRRSGINLIHNVLYNCGSNFNRLNYSGFYTAILERGDEIISAASIRFHGTQLAEMPFIGTRHIYRRQGMCNRLFRAIESALCSFRVEKLIIPAISELMHTWTEVFGFDYLEDSQKEELRSMNILVFPGIDMLRKLLLEDENNHQNVTTSTGVKSMQLEGEPSFVADSLNKSGEDSLVGHDLHACEGADVSHVVGTDDKVADASDSASQGSGVTLNDVSVPSTSLDAPHEVKVSFSSDEIMCANSQSGEKVPESATESKSMFPASQGSGVTLNDVSVPSSSLDAPQEVKVSLSSDEITCANSQSGEKVPESATEPASQGSGVTLNDVSVPSTSLDAPHEKVSLSSDEIMCANSQSGEKVPESDTESKSMFHASQGSGVTFNDVSVPSTSLDAPHEVKVSLSSDEIMCANSQSGEKVPESATESKCMFPASQGSGVTLNDVSVPSTSLDASHEVKVSVSSDEIMCPNSQSGEKVPGSATESKSIFPVDASNVVLEREDNSILDSLVDGDSKFSDDMDVLNGRNNAASVEPVSHSFEKNSAQNATGETDENKDDVSVSSLHGNDENTMQCNSDLDSNNPCEKEGKSCDVSKDASDVPRSNENVVDSSGECAGTGVHEMRTGSQLGHNLSESASDSGTNVPEVKIRSPRGDDVAENASGSKCVSSCNNNQDACKMKNTPTFDTPLGGDIQSSSEADIDGVSVNDSVAGVEPVLILSGEISTHNSTEEINEDKKATSFSTSHGIDESLTEF